MSFKKILAVAMACLMAIGAFAASALTLDVAEVADETVVADEAADLAAEGETLTISESKTITLDGEAYNSIEIAKGIEVVIELKDGTETTVGQIWVPETSKLTINGNTGILNAGKTGTRSAGIGSIYHYAYGGNSGEIIINGGVINATSGYGAAIGGDGDHSGTVTINGGTVTAVSNYGAAIGGGQEGSGTVTINGGTVNATSGYGAAIGGGQDGSGTVSINNATVTAYANHGAAIGGGQYGEEGNVTITSSTVTAAAISGSAIGGGQYGDGNVTIVSSNVTAANIRTGINPSSPPKSAAIGGGVNGNGTVTITDSTVVATSANGAAIGGGVNAATSESSVTFNGDNNVTVSSGNASKLALGNPNGDAQTSGVVVNSGSTVVSFENNATAVINAQKGSSVEVENANNVVINVVNANNEVEGSKTVNGSATFNGSVVYNPKVNGVYLGGSYNNAYLCVEVYDFWFEDTFVAKYYANDTLIAEASLNSGMLSSGLKEAIGCCLGFTGDYDEYWKTTWHTAPNAEQIPDKVEIYVDGEMIVAYDGVFRNTIKGYDPDSNMNWYYELIQEEWVKINGVRADAKIGDKYYATLESAIAAAVDGDTVTIIADGEYGPLTTLPDITIKAADGVVAVINSAATNNSLPVTDADADVVFENLIFNYYPNINYEGYQYNTTTFNNCTINGQIFLYAYTSDTFNNCTFNQTSADAYNVWTYSSKNASFNDCRFNSAGKSVLIYKEWDSNTYNVDINNCVFYASEAVDGKAAIEIDSSLCPFNVEIDGSSATGFDKGSVSGDTLWNLKKGTPEKTDITVNGIDVISANHTIEVVFEKVDLDANNKDNDEQSDIYNIKVVGANETVINRLNSVDLTFVLEKAPFTGAAMDYEIIPVKNITVTPDTTTPNENRYMFSFNGKDATVIGGVDTAVAITFAQVKVSGYGTYTFSVDTSEKANATNVAHATTAADNIVDTYIPGGIIEAGEGLFDLEDSTTGEVIIAVPVRTLTVNVTFPNSVVDNDALYQDMKVEITGNIEGVHKTVTYKLGEDEVAMVDGAYVVTEAKLVLNEKYNVVVSGAGYRTARYTVTMTDAKTLNFWNNVKDNAVEVEEGKATSEVTKNFLAGDIVGDNQINIYDLSAVVSYFATETETDYAKYTKYDLNRDGMIDSKDVAYVLVSWGE